jgi:hypothetical protein
MKAAKAKTVKKPRKRKPKYILLHSPSLMRDTKHELIGEPVESENGRQQWARCTVSHHSQLVNLDALEARENHDIVIQFSKEDAVKYSPRNEYQVGDVIFHAAWDDIGIIRAKEVTSSGSNALVVQFEKLKEKRLIEAIK